MASEKSDKLEGEAGVKVADEKDPGVPVKYSKGWVFSDYWKELVIGGAAVCCFVAGAHLGSVEVITATALLTFFSVIALTPRNEIWAFVLVTAGISAAFAFSEAERWRVAVGALAFLAPPSYVCVQRWLPRRLGKLLRNFSEEASKLESPEEIAVAATRLLGHNGLYKNSAVLAGEKGSEELVVLGCSSVYQRGARIRRGRGICWKAFDSGRPVSLVDTVSNVEFLPSEVKMRSGIAVPLTVGGKKIGVLEIESKRARRFTRADREVIAPFATVLAFAVYGRSSGPNNHSPRQRAESMRRGTHCADGDDVA